MSNNGCFEVEYWVGDDVRMRSFGSFRDAARFAHKQSESGDMMGADVYAGNVPFASCNAGRCTLHKGVEALLRSIGRARKAKKVGKKVARRRKS